MTAPLDADDEPVGAAAKLQRAVRRWRMLEAVRIELGREDVHPPVLVAGRFEVLATVDIGGMGGVFRAKDTQLGREVALKLIERVRCEAEQDLMHEARCLALVRHPNVVTIHDVVKCPEFGLALVMELIPGVTAQAWAATKPSWSDTLGVWTQAGRALEAVHAVGLVHGDVKPNNVMVELGTGSVKVVDFGIARFAEAPKPEEIAGTWPYMAPEVLDNQVPTARSDQWSWSVCCWESLYRSHPFPAQSEDEHRLRCREEPRVKRRRGVPPGIMPILKVGLAVDPDQRHASMGAMLDGLEAVPELVAWRKLTAPEVRMREAAERRRERRKLLWLVGGVMLGWPLIFVVIVMAWWVGEGSRAVTVDEAAEVEPVREVEPSLRVAIYLAEAGRPFDAWDEFRRVDELRVLEEAEIVQALDLAETLLRVAPALPEDDSRDAYTAAESVAWRVGKLLRSLPEPESHMNRAARIRAIARDKIP